MSVAMEQGSEFAHAIGDTPFIEVIAAEVAVPVVAGPDRNRYHVTLPDTPYARYPFTPVMMTPRAKWRCSAM